MSNDRFSGFQLFCFTSLGLFGSSMLFDADTSGGYMSWLSLLIALAAALLFVPTYRRLVRLYPGQGLFDMLEAVWGKGFGRVMTALFALMCLWAASLSLHNLVQFIHTVSLPRTPSLFLGFVAGAAAAWTAAVTPGALGRFSLVFYVFLIITVFSLTAFLIPQLRGEYLLPLNGIPFSKILNGALTQFANPFIQVCVFMVFLHNTDIKKGHKPIFWAILITGLILLMQVLRNIMMLGQYGYSKTSFPSYEVATSVVIHETMLRMEVINALAMLLGAFFRVAAMWRAGCIGAAQVCNLKSRTVLCFALLPVIALASPLVFNSYLKLQAHLEVYRFYTLPVFLLIPLLLWISAEIKHAAAKKRPKILM